MATPSFLSELRRRNVIRMAGLYLVGAWLLVQVAGTVLPMFAAPGWIARTLVIVLAVGFLPALVFAWVFELTPEGLKRDAEVDPAQSIAPATARRMDRTIIAVLALALLYFGIDKFLLAPRRESALVQQARAAAPRPAPKAAAQAGAKSIAVLPFVDMSEGQDQEYFSDGVAEELLNRLAQIPDLRVAARTSAFQFKGRNLDVADVGRQLKVGHVLEGSVRKSGTKLRITAQLINTSSGFHLWSQTFERDAGDVFKVQDEIAAAIAEALEARLSNAMGSPASIAEVDPKAYDDYLQGRALFARRGSENLKLAVAAFDRAIARSPGYAAAHAGRAFALAVSPSWGALEDAGKVRGQALASAERALALDPNAIEPLLARAIVAEETWKIAEARANFARALAQAPDNADVLNFYGDFLALVGDLRGAERLKRKAMAIDPLAFVHPMNLADILLAQRRLDEGLAMAERALALGNPDGHSQVGIALTQLGRFEEAERARQAQCRLRSGHDCLFDDIFALSARGQQARARQVMAELVKKRPPKGPDDHASVAAMHVVVGDIAGATRHLRASFGGTTFIVISPLVLSDRGAVLPEEISRDRDWLAAWQEPKLAPLMDEYRRNLTAFRKGG